MIRWRRQLLAIVALLGLLHSSSVAFPPCIRRGAVLNRRLPSTLRAEWREKSDEDSNQWRSVGDEATVVSAEEWKDVLSRKQDGTFWSSFDPSSSEEETNNVDEDRQLASDTTDMIDDEDRDTEVWLDALQSLSAKEVEFNLKEADRADKVRQMQEWGFDSTTIANTLGVAIDTSLERDDGVQKYLEQGYWDEVDLATVESHKMVDKDENGEPERTQMVYVDEHTCIGCTNCAMIAQSTFFMHSEHGRARVFQQWGDDDEAIQIAIETCPVDCIHYVPYEELVYLEKDRRKQNINFKGRLVSQAEFGTGLAHLGGSRQFTAPQRISGNMATRCSNCPSRGCENCPMYGVGKNPVFEQKEQERKAKIAKRKLQQQRERDQKSAEL